MKVEKYLDSVNISWAYRCFNEIVNGDRFDAPTIAQVLKWLREEKKIYVQIEIHGKGYVCGLYGRKYDDSYLIMEFKNIFKSYEEAAIIGIEYVLDNLI